MAGRKRRRRTRLPVVRWLFLLGISCLAVAGAFQFWPAQAPAPLIAATPTPLAVLPPASAPATAPADVPPAGTASTDAPPTSEPVGQAPAATTATSPPVTARASEPATPVAGTSTPAPAGSNERGRLALIIDDCGQWPATERGFIALPFPVTLSVLPHVRYGHEIALAAEAAGKGVILHLPMQNLAGIDPGPGTITTSMSDDAIRRQVENDLADVPDASGANNHEGSRATADERVMNDVASVLAGDGRFFIDSRTTGRSVAEEVAHAHGIPTAHRDVFLDDVDQLGAVEAELEKAAALAREQGSAIAIGHPRPATLAAVRILAPRLEADGIHFILASDLVH